MNGVLAVTTAVAFFSLAHTLGQTPKLGQFQRELAHVMTKLILDDLKKNYYDPTFHGVDVDARFRQANEKIDQAATFSQVFVDIEWALDGLDSHTHFVSPIRPTRSEYGWQMEMVGPQCLVTAVKPKSDAEKQGLRPGDTMLSVDNYAISRANLSDLRNFFQDLIPQTSLSVNLRRMDGSMKTLNIQATIQQRVRNMVALGENITDLPKMADAWDTEHRSRSKIVDDDLMIWKMPEFSEIEEIDAQASRAKKYKALVLDLRGNPGGALESLQKVVGDLFDHDVKIGLAITRKEKKELVAKTKGGRAYDGKLIVLVDSETASAAEIFARVVQLEKRGIVIGDQTAGAVVVAQLFIHQSSRDNAQIFFYGSEIAVADLEMPDGKRLEGVGVTPDELLLPAPADLAAQRDPVLAHAVSLAGANLSAEDAMKLFPPLWETVVQ